MAITCAVVLLLTSLAPLDAFASSGNAGIKVTKTIDSVAINPVLNLTFAVDKGSAIPGDTLTYSGSVTNTGSGLGASGRFLAEAHGDTTAVVKYYWDELQYCLKGCGQGLNKHWTALAGFVATQPGYLPVSPPDLSQGMTLSATPIPASAVTYPASGDPILGTEISPKALASWKYQALAPLTPSQIAFLSDPAQVASIRNLVHFEVGPRNASAAQPWEDTAEFANPFQSRANAAAITGVTVEITLPDATTTVIGPSTLPGLASLAPGATVAYSTTYKVPVVAAKGASENDADYLKRLAAVAISQLNASALARGTGFSGPVTTARLQATTVEHLPIVGITKTGPGAANAGSSVHYSLALNNGGLAPAASLTVTDVLSDGGLGTVTGVPATLAATSGAAADAAYTIPPSATAQTLTDTASVAWTDANGNAYGPVSSAFATQVSSGVPPELTPISSTVVQGNFFAEPASPQQFSAKPGDTPAFGQTFPNIAFNPPTGLIQYTPTGVNPSTRPFTDVTTNLLGSFTGTIVAQGNGVQAGVGSLNTFNAVFTAQFVVTKPGDVTFAVISDDGFLLGIGGGASRVSGAYENPPASNQSAFTGYPLVGAFNQAGAVSPQTHPVTVHFPAAGLYPYELDYFSCCQQALSLVLTVATFTAQTSPLSIYVGYADGLRQAGSIFPFPWRDSPNVNFIGGTNGGFDAGAIRFDNSSDSPITIDNLTVNVGPVVGRNIWGTSTNPLIVPAHRILILTQTFDSNFDTSDWFAGGCRAGNGVVPVVHVTIGGVTTDYLDSNQVLNTFGYDSACVGNESLSWQRIGGGGTAINVPLPPAVSLSLSPASVVGDVVGQTQSFRAAAMDGTGVPVVNLPVTLNISGPNARFLTASTGADGLASFSYVGHAAGTDNVSATAFMAGLRAASNVVAVPWNIPVPGGSPIGGTPDQAPPTISSPTPADGSLVTAPVAIAAGITPPAGHTISSWSVTYQALAGGPLVTLAQGTGAPPSPLATLDPTLLLNDTYTLTIMAATDTGGVQVLQTTVQVGGNLKLGRSIATYRDLSVPVNGFQMEVSRSYDTADKRTGDFGVGWRLQLDNFRVSPNRPLGAGAWTEAPVSCFILCSWAFKTAAPHFVTLTYPNGHQETFDFTPPPTGLTLIDFANGTAAFSARPGTTSRLEVVKAADRTFTNGFDGNLYDGLGNIYNPTRFKLTTRDGTALILDAGTGLVSEADPAGNTVTVDAAGIHSSAGGSILFTRDSGGRITMVSGPSGEHLSYSYSVTGDLATYTNATGGLSSYTYDAGHNLLGVTGGSATYTNTYDVQGRLVSITDAVGHTTQLSNDVAARTQTMVDPTGALTIVDAYDSAGDLVRETRLFSGTSRVYNYTYDSLGRLLSSTDPTGAITSLTYDSAGDVLSATDPLGNVTRLAYDGTGHLTSVTRPDGVVDTTMTYDASGRLTSQSSSDGSQATYSYDSAGRPTSVSSNRNGTTSLSYTAGGNLASLTNALGATAQMTYDASGHLLSTSGPLGVGVSYSYDALGDITVLTDAAGNSQTATYDAFGRASALRDSAGHTASLGYDAAGRLASSTDANGITTGYTYDVNGNLTQRSAGGTVQTYTYDPLGRLASAVNSAATVTFSYDSAGRLSSQTESGPSLPTTTVGSSYDAAGQLVAISGPQGTINRAYDADGRMTSVHSALGTSTYTYDGGSRLTGLQRANGAADQMTYDSAGRLSGRTTTVNSVPVDSLSYGYAVSGAITSLTHGADTATYTRDAAGRLIAAQHSDPTRPAETFAYDTRNNRTSWSGDPGSYTYNGDDQLQSSPSASFTYDTAGQRTAMAAPAGTTAYAWNANHQLTQVSGPGGLSSTFQYDALGRRVSASDGTTTHAYVYSGNEMLAQYANGTLQSTFTPGGASGRPLSMEQGGHAFYYLQDQQGTVTGLLDGTGSVAQTYSYSAFGAPATASGSVSNPLTYTGLQYDAAAKAYYNQARYYDPQNGVFLSRDPVQAANPYSYVGGDPVDFSDPTGQVAFEYSSILRWDLDIGERALGCVAGALGVAVTNAIVSQFTSKFDLKTTAIDAGFSCALGAVFPAFGRSRTILSKFFPEAAASYLRGLAGYMAFSAMVAFLFGFALDLVNQAICGKGIDPWHAVRAGLWSLPGGLAGGGAAAATVGAGIRKEVGITLGASGVGGGIGAIPGVNDPGPCG